MPRSSGKCLIKGKSEDNRIYLMQVEWLKDTIANQRYVCVFTPLIANIWNTGLFHVPSKKIKVNSRDSKQN